jgi:hypothetical protein
MFSPPQAKSKFANPKRRLQRKGLWSQKIGVIFFTLTIDVAELTTYTLGNWGIIIKIDRISWLLLITIDGFVIDIICRGNHLVII